MLSSAVEAKLPRINVFLSIVIVPPRTAIPPPRPCPVAPLVVPAPPVPPIAPLPVTMQSSRLNEAGGE